MNDAFLLYLLTRVDAVGLALGVAATLSGVFIAGSAAVQGMHSSDDGLSWNRDSLEERKSFRGRIVKYRKSAAICFVISSLFSVAIPSRNDVIFIFGGTAVLEAVRSDRAKSIGTKTLDVIEGYLDDAAKAGAK